MQNVIKAPCQKLAPQISPTQPAAKTQLGALFTTVKEATVLKIFGNISEGEIKSDLIDNDV